MATGDHIQTAVAVGKECGMIDVDTEVGFVKLNRHKDIEINFSIKTSRMKDIKILYADSDISNP